MSIIGNTLQGPKRQSAGVLLSILLSPTPQVAFASIPSAKSSADPDVTAFLSFAGVRRERQTERRYGRF